MNKFIIQFREKETQLANKSSLKTQRTKRHSLRKSISRAIKEDSSHQTLQLLLNATELDSNYDYENQSRIACLI